MNEAESAHDEARLRQLRATLLEESRELPLGMRSRFEARIAIAASTPNGPPWASSCVVGVMAFAGGAVLGGSSWSSIGVAVAMSLAYTGATRRLWADAGSPDRAM